ncbi:LacI family DNA-binding transcriptional regulator (plasmid) [Cetobacterium somerae]|uniref:LacI family DNA-binding transcriptional regulator n=1 Tax=Cetobacterium somerae TaxID=188913 RepID=UPI003D768916
MNIKEIAKLANVSVATVSRVINKDSKVKSATKEKVESIMKQFKYTPNSHAIRLSKGVKDKTIGLIVPDVGNILFSEMVETICSRAEKENITILLCNTNGDYEKEKKFIKLLMEYRVKGVIYISGKYVSQKNYSFLNEIRKQNIPIVFLDRKIEGFDFDGVFLDNYEISYNLTKTLLKIKTKKIYFISGALEISSAYDRFLGFKNAIEQNNNFETTYEIKYGDFKFNSGYELGEEILKNHKDEELTIYVANNTMALGFFKILKKYSKNFKKVIIGIFGTSEILDLLLEDQKYVTCKVQNKEIAEKSFEILLKKIENPDLQNENKKYILYNSAIINKLD